MGIFSPLRTWVDEFIPYYMEIMGVDRPDRTYTDVNTHENERISPENQWLEDVFPIEMVPFLGGHVNFQGEC